MEAENTGKLTGNNGSDSNGKIGYKNPPKHTRFSKDRQPDPEKQKKTKAEKRFSREVLADLLGRKYKFDMGSAVRTQLVNAYGEDVLKLPAGQLLMLRTIQKGILGGGDHILEKLMNQIYGAPKQLTELTGADGGDLFKHASDKELSELLRQTLSKLNDE